MIADGEMLESCTIVTTEPNEVGAKVHDRIPVIVPAKDHAWLSADTLIDDAKAMLRAHPIEGFFARCVSTKVNSVKNQGPSILIAD